MSKGYPDYEGDKQRVYLVPEWAAKEAVDKNMYEADSNVPIDTGSTFAYTVPTGKTLYIVNYAITAHAYDSANRDHNQFIIGSISDNDDIIATIEGNGGAVVTYSKPLAITTGHHIDVTAYNCADHNQNISQSLEAYEV
jgi:hypothetical protein